MRVLTKMTKKQNWCDLLEDMDEDVIHVDDLQKHVKNRLKKLAAFDAEGNEENNCRWLEGYKGRNSGWCKLI